MKSNSIEVDIADDHQQSMEIVILEDPDKELDSGIFGMPRIPDPHHAPVSFSPLPQKIVKSESIDQEDALKIKYMELIHQQKPMLPDDIKANMIQLMSMGFNDYDRNLGMLMKNKNDLQVVCAKLLGMSEN